MHSMCCIILVDSPQSINIAIMGGDDDDVVVVVVDDDDGTAEEDVDDLALSRGGVQTIK